MKTFQTTVKKDPESDDFFIQIPDEMLSHLGVSHLGVEIGDELIWKFADGEIFLKKKIIPPLTP